MTLGTSTEKCIKLALNFPDLKSNTVNHGCGGQRGHLLLRRSKFESRWLLQIFLCLKRAKINTKVVGFGPFKKN